MLPLRCPLPQPTSVLRPVWCPLSIPTGTCSCKRHGVSLQHHHQQSSRRTPLASSAYSQADHSATSAGNLGVLQRVIEVDPMPDDPYGMQRVSPDSFSSRGYYTDGPSIVSSLVLLLVLLALMFQRVLGLDRFLTKALKDWKTSRDYEKRNDVLNARKSLEKSWGREDDEP